MYIQSRAVTNVEAVDRIVLDVDVVHRAGSKDFAELNEVVRPLQIYQLCFNHRIE